MQARHVVRALAWASIALSPLACGDTGLSKIEQEAKPDGGPGKLCPPDCDPPIDLPGDKLVRKEAPNPIPEENAKPGDSKWRNGTVAKPGELELFTSDDSVMAGAKVGVRVSASPEASITAEVYRLGYYGGAGARKIWSGGPFNAKKQAECPVDAATGVVECPWTDTFSIDVGADWTSGVYLVKVIKGGDTKRFAPFVVRDDRAAEILFQLGFNTYQAYNRWGGTSLYYDGTRSLPWKRAHVASFDRPYTDGEGTAQLLRWEWPFLKLLEQYGYDVSYGANSDFLRYSNFLEGISAFVHGGHDEYWVTPERTQIDAALSSGKMSLAYFGANGGYWRSRLEPDASGSKYRRLVCFKSEPQMDPEPNSTIRFRDDPAAHPENELFGSMYVSYENIAFPFVVGDPAHWVYAGTGLKQGELLQGLVGFEFDRTVSETGRTPPGLSIFGESPVVTAEGMPELSQAVERTLPNGRLVFSAGSIFFPLAFATDPEFEDSRVKQLALNVLERALSHRRPARTLPAPATKIPAPPAPIGAWATSAEAYAGAPGPAGHQDGPGAQARFEGPTGLSAASDGRVLVADTRGNRIRLIANDAARTVTTIAGSGVLGNRDGAGDQAGFRQPTQAVFGPDGAVYVADQGNHTIRRIAPDGSNWSVSTFAGLAQSAADDDGPASSARFNRPSALAFDTNGDLYVADQTNNRIRRIDATTHEVTTLAGGRVDGTDDAAVGTNAKFYAPAGIAIGPQYLYVFEAGNQRLRRVTKAAPHQVVTLAGADENAQGYVDGTGTVARFRSQMGLARAADAKLFVADAANFRVRSISPGVDAADTDVRTFAGSGLLGTRLGGGAATDLSAPTGVAVLPDGRVLVTDSYSNVIRVLSR